jgi:capsular polysaccharide export protein
VITWRNQRGKDLISSLGQSDLPKIEVTFAALSLIGASPEKHEVDIAMDSATKQHQSRILRAVKRRFLRAQYAWAMKFFSKQPRSTVFCWNGTKGYRFLLMQAAKRTGHYTIYLEDCPLPERVSVDKKGINFGNSLPRDKRFFEEWARQNSHLTGSWKVVRDQIRQRQALRQNMNTPSNKPEQDLSQAKYIFCPLQVPGDSQLTVYGGWCRTVEKTIRLLHDCSHLLPEGVQFRLKEHPSAKVKFTSLITDLQSDRFVLDNATDTVELIKHSKGVVTVNSSVGLEALFFDKPVATLGKAFYGIDGITRQISSVAGLGAWVNFLEHSATELGIKNAMLDYLITVHFPRESAILSGTFGLKELKERDRLAELLMAKVNAASTGV